jgi:hypothetical protein
MSGTEEGTLARMLIFAAVLTALLAAPSPAKIDHTFMLEGSFVAPMLSLSERVERRYPDWRPGFGIACNYVMLPIKYLGVGARLSYMRASSSNDREVALNVPGMCLLLRPRYEFGTSVTTAVFAQCSPGVYRIVGKDTNGGDLLRDSFFALELGGGVAISSIEFGALYNQGIDLKDSHNMGWLSVFGALRLPLPSIGR